MLSELEAKLGELESALMAFLGGGHSQIAALRTELQGLPDGVTQPLSAIQAKVQAFSQSCRSQVEQLLGELDQLL